MKNFRFAALLLFSLSVTPNIRAQIILDKGNPAELKGVARVNITYDYSNIAVGEFDTEQGYLDKKKHDYRSEPEKFERFRKSWFGARKGRYEPKFEELFNKYGDKIGMQGINYADDGAVTLIVETVFTEPGFNVYVARKDASASFKCTFIKDGREVLVYLIRNVRGLQAMGSDFDAGSRITECYAKCAKMLMKDLTKRLNK